MHFCKKKLLPGKAVDLSDSDMIQTASAPLRRNIPGEHRRENRRCWDQRPSGEFGIKQPRWLAKPCRASDGCSNWSSMVC